MQEFEIPYSQISQFTKFDKLYAEKDISLKPFIEEFPNWDSFEKIISTKSKQQINRELIVTVLTEQYEEIETPDKAKQNVKLLNEQTTFTCITAHQPSLFTGPLYYIYKIISCINIADQLNEQHDNYHFVPMFISGGEDHDFEEINHCNVFNKKISWNSSSEGATGRFSLDGLESSLNELESIIGENSKVKDLTKLMHKWLEISHTYNQFQHHLVNHLFGKYGLVYLSMDNKSLKKEFSSILLKEIKESFSIQEVQTTQSALNQIGLKSQAHARGINVFYLKNGRHRIVKEKSGYKVLDTDISFTSDELENELRINPENFSPNVILRPLYQELLLPNVAYVGGGGELAYWMERKSQFHKIGIPFPILIRRNSALIVESHILKQIENLGLIPSTFFEEEHLIHNAYFTESNSEFSLKSYIDEADKLYDNIAEAAKQVDNSLEGTVKSMAAKHQKQLEQLESKIRKAIKAREAISINKITKIKSGLFPNNGMQERSSNIFQYLSKYGEGFIELLKQKLPPLSETLSLLLIEKDDFQA